MRRRSSKILIIILISIVAPIVAYILYEITNLNENEELIEDIYESQLESALFSVNQYSNDYFNALLDKVQAEYNGKLTHELVGQFSNAGMAVFQIYRADTKLGSFPEEVPEVLELDIQKTIDDDQLTLQLVNYLKNGYRKIQPVTMLEYDKSVYQVIVAILNTEDNYDLFVGLVDPLLFTQEVLKPKMQEIAGEDMVITLQRENQSEPLFTTEEVTNSVLVSRQMWLFPDLLVGISPKNLLISDLVKNRIRNNLIAIGLLIMLLAIGFTLIMRNINQEMQLAQNKSDFVSSVSHELRTPLALISMFAETLMLNRVKDKAKKNEYIEIIFKETNRLTNIVNRILNFSRIEAGKRTYHFSQIELNELLEEVCRDYSFHLTQNGFEHHLEKAPGEIELFADREAIYEAVVNLIDNAIKYSNDTKKLVIKTGSDEDRAWISLKDYGIGIAPEKLHQIFDKFYRVSDKDVYVAQGAGLGLTIISHIIEAHQGSVDVQSDPGKGSTFTLYFSRNLAQS
jgi:two-component system phosphate regulon sensor histidine kinase PhoR